MGQTDRDIEAIIQFWLGEADRDVARARDQHERWYRGGPEVDEEIRERFGAQVEEARAGGFSAWAGDPKGATALVILLDQFTRNLFRGTVDAYSGDAYALEVAKNATANDLHLRASTHEQIFLFHPYHHSELVLDQDMGVTLMKGLRDRVDDSWREYMNDRVKGFSGHRDIVARFGRFPHRNEIIARESTADESLFLAGGAQDFGQRKSK